MALYCEQGGWTGVEDEEDEEEREKRIPHIFGSLVRQTIFFSSTGQGSKSHSVTLTFGKMAHSLSQWRQRRVMDGNPFNKQQLRTAGGTKKRSDLGPETTEKRLLLGGGGFRRQFCPQAVQFTILCNAMEIGLSCCVREGVLRAGVCPVRVHGRGLHGHG